MAGFLTKIEYFFKQKSVLSNLIAINVIVFVLIRIFGVITTLFKLDSGFILNYLELPSDPGLLATHVWTFITYMFTHYDFLHILFNMLWLYWFGKIFLTFFNPRQLGALYLLGGLAGAFFYILAYNTFPYFEDMVSSSFLIGASASVMAIVFGVAFYQKDLEIGLLFLGRIKIIYIAIFILVLDMLAITSSNAGGHIAHIGGALMGILYAMAYHKGKDITNPLTFLLDQFANLFKKGPKRKMKVKYNKSAHSSGGGRQADYDYNAQKNRHNEEIDKILDKIKKSGYSSLTSEEKKKLFDASNK